MKDMDEFIQDLPFAVKMPCRACGSSDWAHANLSPRDFVPEHCDRCPPKDKDLRTHKASQEIL